ncbi:MAG: nitroreductase family protein [Nanoarchaeota archaeon]|nr:nitroreductase family protein [Nanoarchaeota archaeon]
MNLDKTIDTRKSIRKFKTTKKPNWKKIVEAIDAAIKAPLAGNIPNLKFILVDDPEKIQLLAEAAQQDFISQCHYVVVAVSDDSQLVRAYDERGTRYARQQSGAAIENFLLKITEQGLATCWIGDFVDHQVKDILTIPDDLFIEAFFPIGYEFGNSKQRLKPRLDTRMYFNTWKEKYMVPTKKVEAI